MSKLSYIVELARGVRFKVNIPCSECSLTLDVIADTFETEPAGVQARSPHSHYVYQCLSISIPKFAMNDPGTVCAQAH